MKREMRALGFWMAWSFNRPSMLPRAIIHKSCSWQGSEHLLLPILSLDRKSILEVLVFRQCRLKAFLPVSDFDAPTFLEESLHCDTKLSILQRPYTS